MRIAIALLVALATPATAQSVDVASCGASSGYGYFPYRGLMKKEKAGWTKVDTPNGKISLKLDSENNFDIFFVDARGEIFSYKESGFKVFPVSITSESASIVAVYQPQGITETYVFQKLANGKAQVMWTSAKAESLIATISANVADCAYLHLPASK